MQEYLGVAILVFLAVLAAVTIAGSVRAGRFHIGLPDQ